MPVSLPHTNSYNEQQQYGSTLGTMAKQATRPSQPIGTAASLYSGPAGQQLQMREQLLRSNRGIIDLSNPFSSQNMAEYGANQNVRSANRQVLGATQRQNQGQRDVLADDLATINMRSGNFERILAARNDVSDQSNVGLYNEYLNARDTRNRMFGAAPEQRITLPAGATQIDLPAGQVYAGRTNAEQVAETAEIEERRKGFLSDALRNRVSGLGMDVQDARLNAAYAGDDASRLREENQRSEQMTRYEDALLRNEAEMMQLPPFPGATLWEDPYTGESSWVTRAEKDAKAYDYARQLEDERYPMQQRIQQQRQQQQKQEQTGGSPLGALSESLLMERIKDASGFVEVMQELVRRYMQQGFSRQQAEEAAYARIQAEIASRKPAKPPASTGGGYETIN